MEKNRQRDANTVLLPAFDTTFLSDSVKRFLENGGCSILLGESREEYVTRKMSEYRRSTETAETFFRITKEAADLTGELLAAVDQEIGGICRLHGLVPAFPGIKELVGYDIESFENICAIIAKAAKDFGVNCFLGPVLDVVTGTNPWLSGRTWSAYPHEIARISTAYIRGVQSAGVAAAAKHFPGFHNIDLDPAIESEAVVTEKADSFLAGFIPFADAIKAGVELIMVGPAIVEAFDQHRPASISPVIINMLQKELGFDGVVMSDDLDSQATLKGRTVEQIAIDALNAGSDFLLIADIDDQLERVPNAICNAVEKGDLEERRLNEAGEKVRALAKKYSG